MAEQPPPIHDHPDLLEWLDGNWQQEVGPMRPHPPVPVWNLDGVPWCDAKRHRRWRRCRPQTRGYVDGQLIERCACGGMRFGSFGPWIGRFE